MSQYIALRLSDVSYIKFIKIELERLKLLNKTKKIERLPSGARIFTLCTHPEELKSIDAQHYEIEYYEYEKTTISGLHKCLIDFLTEKRIENGESLAQFLPTKWSYYVPMVLVNPNTFESSAWKTVMGENNFEQFISILLKSGIFGHGATHLAINMPIIEMDVMRRPFHLVPIYGDFKGTPTIEKLEAPSSSDFRDSFWCSVIQNGIFQTWAPRYTMFSRGNIKEKKRILDAYPNLHNTTVVDLYAGIGYFSLSYLMNGATLLCWEINPWSIEALRRNIVKNGFRYKLINKCEALKHADFLNLQEQGVRAFIFFESNEYALERLNTIGTNIPISHINLGLLPTSKPSWSMSKVIFTNSTCPCIVHLHENIHKNNIDDFAVSIESYFRCRVSAINKVKTFAPDVWHVVLDIQT